MDYWNFFGKNFEDLKRDVKDFAESLKDMAAEGMQHAPDPACSFKFTTKDPSGFGDLFFPRTNTYILADRSLVFEFLLPGFSEKNIHLSFKGDKMVLKARLPEAGEKREGLRFERRSFNLREIDSREYSVPADRYNQSAVKALFRNGILTVTIPSLEDGETEGAVKIEIVTEDN